VERRTLSVWQKAIRFSLGLLLVFSLATTIAVPQAVHAAAPLLASDILGQTDPAGNPSYTTGEVNNSAYPNSKGFHLPRGVVVDTTNHRLFVADALNNRILVFNLSAGDLITDRTADYVLGQTSFTANTAGSTASTLNVPNGLALDSARQLLWVADVGNHRVLGYDISAVSTGMSASYVLGQASFTANAAARTQTGMDSPSYVAYDQSGTRLFVGEGGNGNNQRVTVFDLATITSGEAAVNVLGQADFTSVGAGTLNGMLGGVWGLAYDAAGQRLFAADSGYRVKVFDVAAITNGEDAVNILGTASLSSSGSQGAAPTASNMSNIDGVAFDAAANMLFVSDRGHFRVMVFDVAAITNGEAAVNVLGASNFTSSGSTTSSATTVRYTSGLGYDAGTDRLYVADGFFGRVTVFDASAITNNEAAVDGLGQIKADGTMRFDKGWPNNAQPSATGFQSPYGSVTDYSGRRLFITDADNSRVLVFNLNASGNLIDRTADAVLGQADFTSDAPGTTQSTLDWPQFLAYDQAREWLYVTDYDNNRIMVFDVASITNGEAAVHVLGQPNFTSNGSGNSASEFDGLGHLAYDQSNKRLFVADNFNSRVVVFDMTSPSNGMAATNLLGQASFGALDSSVTASTLDSPMGVAYDEAGQRLFVADEFNYRVLQYDVASITDGEAAVHVLGQSNFTSSGGGSTTADAFDDPMGLTYDPDSQYLYVTDFGHRVMGFDTASITDGEAAVALVGEAAFTDIGNLENSQSEFGWNGENISFDPSSGNLYVADWHEFRVLNFRLLRLVAATLPAGTEGSSYLGAITSTHGQGSQAYSLKSGSLPPGISLAANGSLSGTPSAAGTYNFAVRATDSNSTAGVFADTQSYSITVDAASEPPDSSSNEGSQDDTTTTTTTTTTTSVPDTSPDEAVISNQPEFTTTGVVQTLAEGEEVVFDLPANDSATSSPTERHTATINAVGTDYVDLTIASDPIQLRLYLGEQQTVDVTSDGQDDLLVKLLAITSGKAQLMFKQLAAEPNTLPPSEPAPEVTTTESAPVADTSTSSPWLVWLAVAAFVVVLVLVGVVIFVKRRAASPTMLPS
jgi:DNA-binding beta-propeller fold protein YncE